MHRTSTLRKTDEAFIAFANSLCEQCTQHSAEWNIDSGQIDTLTALTNNAKAAYAANLDSVKHNRGTTVAKNEAFKNLRNFLSWFINYLESNHSVPDGAIASMGLRSRKYQAHRPLPPPGEAPVLSVTSKRGEITAYAGRLSHGHPTEGLKVTNYHGFKLRWRFENESEDRVEVSTRRRCTLYFKPEDKMKRVFMSAAWINPRLEAGPWSDEIEEIVW